MPMQSTSRFMRGRPQRQAYAPRLGSETGVESCFTPMVNDGRAKASNFQGRLTCLSRATGSKNITHKVQLHEQLSIVLVPSIRLWLWKWYEITNIWLEENDVVIGANRGKKKQISCNWKKITAFKMLPQVIGACAFLTEFLFSWCR